MATDHASGKLGVLVGGTRFGDPKTNEIRFSLDILDLDQGAAEPSRILLGFLAHGFTVQPRRTREAAVFEKRGPGGAYVDLVARSVLKTIEPLPGHHFYGHGAFSSEGDALFAVETSLSTNDGMISVRDPSSFEALDRFPTYGMAPHDCMLIEDGKTLVITNGGGKTGTEDMPSVAFVDVASRKLLDLHKVSDPNINTGHVAMGRGHEFMVVSAPRDGLPEDALGGVSLRQPGRALEVGRGPERVKARMKGESLSVCIHEESRTAIATHPYGHFISFWNLDAGALFGALDMPNPRGVTLTLDRRYFVISFGSNASLMLIETKPLRPITDRDFGQRRFGGSHIYVWAA